jgi:diguanylate cyclase
VIIDINTVLIVTVGNIVSLAIASPMIMGRDLGTAANAARQGLIVQAAGWVCMIFSNLWPETWIDRLLSTAAISGFSATSWLMFLALQHWLGPRRLERWMTPLAVIIPVGYCLMFSSYALRVGWANFLLALQMALVAQACFAPRTPLHGPWRMVVAFGMSTTAILTLGRGILGAFTPFYPTFLTPHPWNIAAMMMANMASITVNFAILGGWHEEAEVALRNQAITDTLSGLLNRRGWIQVAGHLLAQAKRHDLPLALLMLDIDYFKKINDSHGHEAGDLALRAFGRLLRENTRSNDVAARIGG